MRRLLVHSVPLAVITALALGGPATAGSTPPPASMHSPVVAATGFATPEDDTPRPRTNASWPQTIESRLSAVAHRVATTGADAAKPTETAFADEALVSRLDRLVALASRRADVAVSIRELDTGAVVFDHQGDQTLNPASNQKLLTSVAAVELLGADYRFETRVARHGDALYLVGEGDPSLQVEDLEQLAAKVATAANLDGIRRIVIDDSAFSSRRFGPGYDPDGPGYSYMAPSGALSLQFNTVEIEVAPTRIDEPPTVTVQPACAHIRIASAAVTARRGRPAADTHAEGSQTVVEVHGRIARSRAPIKLRRRIHDPGHFTGTTFAALLGEALQSEPLPVERGNVPDDAVAIATHTSAPLSDVLASALKFSNNFTTEQVLRTLGWRMTGRPGDWDNGSLALQRFWQAMGMSPSDLSFENASGLSQSGRVTARALVDLLELTVDGETEAAQLWSSMPVAGREGTLRGRLRSTHGRVRAKTGTLRNASALSGVVMAENGEPRVGFSILVNGRLDPRRSRRIQDRVVAALVAHVQ